MPLVRELFAIVLLGCVFSAILVALKARVARSLGELLPLAVVLLIGCESTIVNLLSVVHGVRPVPMSVAHVALVAGLVRLGGSPRDVLRIAAFRLRSAKLPWALAPLFVLLAVTVLVYPPTNWDSMTYHMARVAYWMQAHSVDYYPTGQPAQNTMGPGAEYVLLLLQVVSGGDQWANSVQLLAFAVCVASVPSLCRVLGMPKCVAPWTALFIAGLPIVVLEATTTQNDIVAGVTTLAIISAALPFSSRAARKTALDCGLLAASLTCSYLVKPTASLAALPFVALVAARYVRVARARQLAMGTGVGLATCIVVLGPDVARKLSSTGSVFGGRNEIYPVLGQWADRLFNSVRAYGQHALVPVAATARIQAWQVRLFGNPTTLFARNVFAPNEDRAGNPIHAALCLLFIALLATAWLAWALRLPGRPRASRLAVASTLPAAWIVVHAFLRNQEFLTRLEIPIFVSAPLLFVPFFDRRVFGARITALVFRAVVILGLGFGMLAAVGNEFRPLSVPFLIERTSRDNLYYMTRPQVRAQQDAALFAMKRSGCRRVGLYIDSQAYDYPLAWRAMQTGIEVRRYVDFSSWPCAVYSELGRPPEGPDVSWLERPGGLWSRQP